MKWEKFLTLYFENLENDKVLKQILCYLLVSEEKCHLDKLVWKTQSLSPCKVFLFSYFSFLHVLAGFCRVHDSLPLLW